VLTGAELFVRGTTAQTADMTHVKIVVQREFVRAAKCS
jgi:hypothetical protein